MTNISIYDTTATDLDKIDDEISQNLGYHLGIAEIIEALVSAVNNGDIEITDYI